MPGTALILAALGIYSVLSYSVSRRVPEIGIRMALGESGVQVLGRVVARTMTLAGIRVLIGGIGSFVASRLIASLLHGLEPTDPLPFAAMVAILLSAAALAGFLPARKASRTDPMAALRVDGGGPRNPQSARRAPAGSVDAALRGGTQDATRATPRRPSPTTA